MCSSDLLITTTAVSDTFALLPWWWVQDHGVAMADVRWAVLAVGVLAGLAFVGLPRRALAVLPVLRLPEVLPWAERLVSARAWLARIQPDWLSLQFVIYGYAKKGLPWRLAHRLGALCDSWRVHVMVHETWIGFMSAAVLAWNRILRPLGRGSRRHLN